MPIDPEEWATLVDENDNVIGRVLRSEVRARKLWHRGVGVIVRNSAGEIYVHRRSRTKDVFPGMYDALVGGLVGYGESYEEAARRELAEELGITGAKLRYLFTDVYEGLDNPNISAVFEVRWDGPIVHEAEEIDWGTFLSIEEADARMAEWKSVPDGNQAYTRWREGGYH